MRKLEKKGGDLRETSLVIGGFEPPIPILNVNRGFPV